MKPVRAQSRARIRAWTNAVALTSNDKYANLLPPQTHRLLDRLEKGAPALVLRFITRARYSNVTRAIALVTNYFTKPLFIEIKKLSHTTYPDIPRNQIRQRPKSNRKTEEARLSNSCKLCLVNMALWTIIIPSKNIYDEHQVRSHIVTRGFIPIGTLFQSIRMVHCFHVFPTLAVRYGLRTAEQERTEHCATSLYR